jgi:hypothetical protein
MKTSTGHNHQKWSDTIASLLLHRSPLTPALSPSEGEREKGIQPQPEIAQFHIGNEIKTDFRELNQKNRAIPG